MLHGSTGLRRAASSATPSSRSSSTRSRTIPISIPPRLHRRGPARRTTPAPAWSVGRDVPGCRDSTVTGRTSEPSTCCGSTARRRSSASSTSRAARSPVGGRRRPDSAQWGTYLQGVLEVYGPFYLVGRYEHFDPPFPEPARSTCSPWRRRLEAVPLHGRQGRVPLRRPSSSTTKTSTASSPPSPRSSEMRTHSSRVCPGRPVWSSACCCRRGSGHPICRSS